MGPLVNAKRRNAIEAFIADAREHGATVLTGRARIGDRGPFRALTLLDAVPDGARVMLPYDLAAHVFCGSLLSSRWGPRVAVALELEARYRAPATQLRRSRLADRGSDRSGARGRADHARPVSPREKGAVMQDENSTKSRKTGEEPPRSVTVPSKTRLKPARKREDGPRRPLPPGEYRAITDRGEPTSPRERDHDHREKY
jgi:hypothetical protein